MNAAVVNRSWYDCRIYTIYATSSAICLRFYLQRWIGVWVTEDLSIAWAGSIIFALLSVHF